MKQRLPYIFSVIIVMACTCKVYGQDTTKIVVEPGLNLYIDYGKILTLPSNFEMKAEAGLAYRMKNKFSPNVQVGMARLEPSGAFENGTYLSEGVYGRVGIDYLIPFDPVNTLYIGVKYGMTMFDEQGHYEIGSTLWADRAESFSRTGLEADWFEVIFGSEKKLSKKSGEDVVPSNWSLGGYLSLRILNSRPKFEPIDTYAIPGYGRSFDRTVPAVNVYIRYGF